MSIFTTKCILFGVLLFLMAAACRDHRLQRQNRLALSLPSEIYREIYLDVETNDMHSKKIAANKIGLTKGAYSKSRQGIITSEQLNEITALVRFAPYMNYRPLLYLIPFNNVKELLKSVPPQERASPLAPEFIISDLPRRSFDVIKYEVIY
jgi:hypothetical protein